MGMMSARLIAVAATFYVMTGISGAAVAQTYPAAPQPPGVYRGAPVDDDDAVSPPNPYGRPPPPAGAIQRDALPPPGYAAPSPGYAAQPPGYAAQPPGYAAPPQGYAAAPPYGGGYQEGPPAAQGYGRGYSYGPWEPVRPPGDVYGPGGSGGSGYAPGGPAGRPYDNAGVPGGYSALPPDYQPESGQPRELPPQFRRQLVDYPTRETAGTIVIDTPNTYLYLVLGNGKALRYGIGVGREGFTWSGREKISKMAEWPDWHPPKEMIDRQPYLPRFMAGGESNPLGARALYLGNTLYRIHGTNQPSTIGTFVSSGCIRLANSDIEDLYGRVTVGTRVLVLPGRSDATASVR
jgi:lipoprotein-anchoring transpeptidase ErfK/SrfK